jgi:hypothetical protein
MLGRVWDFEGDGDWGGWHGIATRDMRDMRVGFLAD